MSRKNFKQSIQANLQAFATHSYVLQSQIAGSFGLHPTDVHALHALEQSDRLTAGQLGQQLGLTSGATTAAIDRLIALGYAVRAPDETDRRRVYISLDQRNTGNLKSQYAAIDHHVSQVLDSYTQDQLNTILNFLNALSKPPDSKS